MIGWILIVLMSTGSSQGGPAGFSQEFQTRTACEIAAKEIRMRTSDEGKFEIRYIGCFAKGDNK